MEFDVIISGGDVVDGSGTRQRFAADVGLQGDRIAALGDLRDAQAATIVDAGGLVVCPGFVDVHVHSEIALLGGRDQMAALRQGVTTHLLAPDGFGWAPLPPQIGHEMWRYTQFAYGDVALWPNWPTVDDYLALFPGHIPANVYPQVPHCAVRLAVMGWAPRPATGDELLAMERVVEEWMDAGAGALSLGLDYQPSVHADLRELVALSRVVASRGGIYAAHLRKALLGRRAAWEETLEVARQAEIPVHISHERVDEESVGILEQVGREGLDLTFESYLYAAGMTHLAILLPVDVQAGGMDAMLARMQAPSVRERSLDHLRGELGHRGDQIVGYTGSGRFVGMTLAEAAEAEGKEWADFAYDLIMEEEGLETFVIPWTVSDSESEQVIEQTALHARHIVASDGVYGLPHPHPRGYGCFARVLRRFVRETGLLSLERAIHKMSGLPAQRFGLADRGRVEVGAAADLVLFDPGLVADHSTWREPLKPATGVERVMVNGEWVIDGGLPTGRLPGRVLCRAA